MNRREALLNTGAMAIAASVGALACAAQNAAAQPAVSASSGAGLSDLAFDCVKKGTACSEHCARMLSGGDTSMAECFAAVRDMVAATSALAQLAVTSSKHLPAAARLAAEVCDACAAACSKHATTHAVCKDCADACTATSAACRKVSG